MGTEENVAVSEAVDPLSRYGIVERDGAVVTTALQPVCNFIVVQVRSGSTRYLDGREEPYHEAKVQLTDGSRVTWAVHGTLYEPKNWATASNGTAFIANRIKFCAYIFQRLERDGIRQGGTKLCRSELVGTYLDSNDKLCVSRGLENKVGGRMTLYVGADLPCGGSKEVFNKMAKLTKDDTVKAMLVHALGSVLKPALGGFYPHTKLEGDQGTGKTTILAELAPRLGFMVVDAQAQFNTSYRLKLALSGTNLPIFADEIGRVKNAPARQLVDVLNVAYGSGFSTQGAQGNVFRLMAPLVGTGQDWYIRDQALSSKMLIYRLDKAAKDLSALSELRQSDQTFPLMDYLEFACDYANSHHLLAMVSEKIALLRERMPVEVQGECAESDRCLWNYAVQLIVADMLIEYGVDADVEDYVVNRLAEHLTPFAQEGRSVPRRFVEDLTSLLARRSVPAAAVYDVGAEGLYVHMESCLKALASAGYGYDVDDPTTITRLLVAEGIGIKDQRHYFNRIRKRCVLIPHEQLEARGCKIDLGNQIAP